MSFKVNMLWDIDTLLLPIRSDRPCGDDLSFSPEFDAIGEARRFDDPTIDQGDWQIDLKEADWNKVMEMTSTLLQFQSKDLRLAVWLTEASFHVYGFHGLTQGLKLISELCDRYWDYLIPESEQEDYELRTGNLGWLLTHAEQWLKQIPLTEGAGGIYSFITISNVRNHTIDNEHKSKGNTSELTLEAINNALRSSSPAFFENLTREAQDCLLAIGQLQTVIDARLGMEGPSFAALKQSLDDVVHLLGCFRRELGLISNEVVTPEFETNNKAYDMSIANAVGPIRSRTDALNHLKAVARYFRETEPHSPVAYLADKAARWGNLPLHEWLKSVIKDDVSLLHVEELLGISGSNNEDA